MTTVRSHPPAPRPAGTSRPRADLHTHSTCSDGCFSPTDLVHRARAAGLEMIALTDHDTVRGIAEAQAAGRAVGVEVIPGIEMSVREGEQEYHLLGYFIEGEGEGFQRYLDAVQANRVRRIRRMVDRLQARGIAITYAEVEARANGTVGRPHVARALVDRGVVKDIDAAFDEHLAEGRPGFVRRDMIGGTEGVALIRAMGGVPVLAHPGLYDSLAALPALVAAGLEGLEVFHPKHPPETVATLERLAAAHGLVPTGGSDFHGDGAVCALGARTVDAAVVDRLRTLRPEGAGGERCE